MLAQTGCHLTNWLWNEISVESPFLGILKTWPDKT